MITSWQDRSVWVIGAGHGIGEAFCRQLAGEGAKLILSGRHLDALEQLARTLSASRTVICPVDITQQASVIACLEQQQESIDLVAIFAGAYQPGAFIDHSAADIMQIMQTNATGVMLAAQTVLERFQRQGYGHLLLLGSAVTYAQMPNASVYGASKAALRYFALSLATEFAHHEQIHITLVSPGFVQTRLTAKNRFKMPFLFTPAQAAAHIIAGLARQPSEIRFPWQLLWLLRLINLLPVRLKARVLGG